MKLISFVTCSQVLNDPELGPTIVSALQTIGIAIQEGAPPPPTDAVMPKEWAVFTGWSLTDEEKVENKSYTQVIQFFWPDGKQFVMQRLTSSPQNGRDFLTFVVRLNGFPIGQVGKIGIQVSLEAEDKIVWGPESSFVSCVHSSMPLSQTSLPPQTPASTE